MEVFTFTKGTVDPLAVAESLVNFRWPSVKDELIPLSPERQNAV